VKLAISAWADAHAGFVLDPVAAPSIRVGVSGGIGQGIWDQAGFALQAALDGANGDGVVFYQSEDLQVRRIEDRVENRNTVLAAFSEGKTMVANQRIELIGRAEQSWTWLRLSAAIAARGSSFDLVPSFDAAPLIGRQLEQFVLGAAAKIVTTKENPVRVTVPVSRELLESRSFNERLFPIMERSSIPPSRVVFEIEEHALGKSPERSTELIKKLDQIGSAVAIRNCSGNWATWELCTELAVKYIVPTVALYDRFGEGNRPAQSLLSSMATTCNEIDVELIAPFSSRLVPVSTLTEAGFTHIERGPTTGTSLVKASRSTNSVDIGFSPRKVH